jgi:nuclear pore complex protein Nup98-Nup96
MDELQNMNRIQRQKIDKFTVGRENVGYIEFLYPVDVSGIELDELCGGIIQLEPRSATVYPISAKKPPVGKGLNVPAQITLEQSWPRGGRDKRIASDPKRFNKHIERLKRIPDTKFINYDKDTGIWTFSVEHFTTYGLDDSDEESDEEIQDYQDESSIPLANSIPVALDASMGSSMDDDTFDFRRPRGVPGAFDEQESMMEVPNPNVQSFLGVSSADSAPNAVRLSLEKDDSVDMGDEYDLSGDEDMTRSLPGQHHAAEHVDASSEDGHDAKFGTPGGILRARMRAMKDSVGPVKLEVADGDDWMEMLRKTVSPAKRDRQLLKNLNESPSRQNWQQTDATFAGDENLRKSYSYKSTSRTDKLETVAAMNMDKGRGFATSIDLMNSLFEKSKPAMQSLKASVPAKGFPKVGTTVII